MKRPMQNLYRGLNGICATKGQFSQSLQPKHIIKKKSIANCGKFFTLIAIVKDEFPLKQFFNF